MVLRMLLFTECNVMALWCIQRGTKILLFMPIRDRPFFIRVGEGGWWDLMGARKKNMALKEDSKEKK